MGLLGVGLVFVGYVMCYASVANGGRFTASPWEGVRNDAYDADKATP
jgi:hypothetical protein